MSLRPDEQEASAKRGKETFMKYELDHNLMTMQDVKDMENCRAMQMQRTCNLGKGFTLNYWSETNFDISCSTKEQRFCKVCCMLGFFIEALNPVEERIDLVVAACRVKMANTKF